MEHCHKQTETKNTAVQRTHARGRMNIRVSEGLKEAKLERKWHILARARRVAVGNKAV